MVGYIVRIILTFLNQTEITSSQRNVTSEMTDQNSES
jgi:hypothetical protein